MRSKRFDEAERLGLQALEIGEQNNGPFDPSVAGHLQTLSDIYAGQKKTAKAISFAKRAVSITEALPGPESHEYRSALFTLAKSYELAGQFRDAKALFLRLIELCEKSGESAMLSTIRRDYSKILNSKTNSDDAH